MRRDPVGVETGTGEQNPMLIHTLKSDLLEPDLRMSAPEGFCQSRYERASNGVIADPTSRSCVRLDDRTSIIAGKLKVCPSNELLLEWGGRRMKPDNGGIEVCTRLGIDRRNLAFPRVSYRLTELTDVLTIVAEVHGELLPADRSGPLGTDSGQSIR